MNSTTHDQVAANPTLLTEAMKEYLGKVNITAQATYDRWPEATGMRREVHRCGSLAGLTTEQVVYDLNNSKIECDGGRW